MVLHSDFPALPLNVTVMRVLDRSFSYHPRKADGTRDETRTETVSRRVAQCQYCDVNGQIGFCVLVPCRDWRDCSFEGLQTRDLRAAVVEVQEDRNSFMPILRISGFEVLEGDKKSR